MARSGKSRGSRAAIAVAAALFAGTSAAGCGALLGLGDVPVPADAGTQLEAGAPEAGPSLDAAPDAVIGAVDSSTNTIEAGPCGDTQSTGTNCGTCGHDCLGGACVSGACQPFALVAPDSGVAPSILAQDDTYLYWTDYINSTVTRTDKTTGETLAMTGMTSLPEGIALDDAGIYWGDAVGVWRCPKASCMLDITLVSTEANSAIHRLAVDDVGVYWTEEGAGAILTAPKEQQDQTPATLWEGDAATDDLVSDGQRVYFTATDGWLHVVGVDGGGVLSVGGPSAGGSSSVTLDDGGVYWSTEGTTSGTIERAQLSDLGDAQDLAPAQQNPTAIASDGTHVYWLANATSQDGGATMGVFGCSIAACAPTLLATGAALVWIVVDSAAVYWTDEGNRTTTGSVWKLAK